MVNYEKLADFYKKIFPDISKEDHLMIIKGALDGKEPAMTKSGFIGWYNQVGEKLQKKKDIINYYIKSNPHFIMHRETMVLGGDWIGESLLEVVLK